MNTQPKVYHILFILSLSMLTTPILSFAASPHVTSTKPSRTALKKLRSKLYKSALRAKQILKKSLKSYQINIPKNRVLHITCRGSGQYHGHYSKPQETKTYDNKFSMTLHANWTLQEFHETFSSPRSRWKDSTKITTTPTGLQLSTKQKQRQLSKKSPEHIKWYEHFRNRCVPLLLQDAIRHPLRLQWLATQRDPNGLQDLILYTSESGKISMLYINQQTHLLDRVERLVHHPVLGDGIERLHYASARNKHTRIPTQIDHQRWGEFTRSWRCNTTIQVLPRTTTTRRGKQSEFSHHKIAQGLYLVSLLAHNHRVLLAEFDKGLGVFEAPRSDKVGQQLIAYIQTHFPKQPIRFLFLTHHHPDHAGGFRPFVAQGIPVVTTQGNQRFFDQQLQRPHQLSTSSPVHVKGLAKFLFVKRQRVFQDTKQRVEVYDVGIETHHTKEHLIFYFPKQGIVFEGDLTNLYKHQKRVANTRTLGLYQSIRKRKLKVTHIIQSWPRKHTRPLIPFTRLQRSATLGLKKATKSRTTE